MGNSVILAFLFLLLLGCKKPDKPDCPFQNPDIYNQISDTANHWFENITNTKTLYAYSNKGKTESYTISFTSALWNHQFINCSNIDYEKRTLSFQSSLYNHQFYFVIRSNENQDELIITNNASYDFWGNNLIEMNPKTDTTCRVLYSTSTSYSKEQTNMSVQKIDSLMLNSTHFYNVYKIDVKDSLYSFNNKTKVLYFNSRYGLIKFETFDGEVWSLY